jgi:hypothetical protein
MAAEPRFGQHGASAFHPRSEQGAWWKASVDLLPLELTPAVDPASNNQEMFIEST